MKTKDISLRPLSGSKGSAKTTSTADNLFSTDIVEVVLGISEGPIQGLEDGAKSFLIGDTPLQSQNGDNNFDSFELVVYRGSEEGETINSRMGGFGSSTTVNTSMASDTWVTRQGLQTNIDYLDVRFAVNQLVKSNSKGTFQHTGKFRVEYKAVSATEWTKVTSYDGSTPPSVGKGEGILVEIFRGVRSYSGNVSPAEGDRATYLVSEEPILTTESGIWFNTANNYRPSIWNGESWSVPGDASYANGEWTWTEGSLSIKAIVGVSLSGHAYKQGDYWIDTANSAVYFYNGSTWIIAGSSLNPGGVGDNATGGSVVVNDGEIAITGKTTSAFAKEFRIPVARIDEPYMIRAMKTSPENTTELFFDITWESFQEVSAESFVFPGLSAAQLVARASDQFSSIPDFSGIYLGRIVRVPSNYDPVARTYTGVWDGTWKIAYSNNPAYVTYDLVTNDRYGMNAYYPVTLNKWDVYEAGQWCDQRTEDGLPRFTFNGLISEPRGGRDAINYICGIFGGRFFDDGNGSAVIKLDKDGAYSAVFSPENVVDGLFTYSFTEISTRHNDVTVTFVNPDLNWQEDRRRVYDQDYIDRYNRIPLDFIAVGCTSEKEAIVRARYKLITGLTETMMVNFKTNRIGLYLTPYDVILIADEDMDFGLSGRVKEVTGSHTFSLRDPLYLEAGFSYRVTFQTISEATDDFVTETRVIAAATTGAVSQITVTEALPDLPDNAVFTIEQTNGSVAPMAFRVLSITEVDGDPDNVDIQAIQINRAKWLYIDGLIDTIDEVNQYLLNSRVKPEPVSNLKARASSRRSGTRTVYDLRLSWDASPTPTVTLYRILGARNDGPMSTLATTSATDFEWDEIPVGEYVFQVIAVDVNTSESDPVITEYRLVGDYKVVDGVSSLRLVDEPSNTIFESRSPTFAWAESANADHQEYVIRILTPDDVIIREEVINATSYTYEYTINTSDGGGTPRRAFKFAVASRDNYGFLSDYETISVSNPAPDAPVNQSVELNYGAAVVQYEVPPLRDFVGVMVHASTQNGFTPSEENLVYKGPSNNISLLPGTGQTWYFRLAYYDVFGEDGLNYGTQLALAIPTPSNEVDTTPPGVPINFDVQDGVGFLTATWTDPSDSDFSHIEIYIGTVNDVTQAAYVTDGYSGFCMFAVEIGTIYYVWARSVDTSGNRSDFVAAGSTESGLLSGSKILEASLEASKIMNESITELQLADEAVSTAKIALEAITAELIANEAIIGSKLAVGAVDATKFASDIEPVTLVDGPTLPTTKSTSTIYWNGTLYTWNGTEYTAPDFEVEDGSITQEKIASAAVTASKLANEAVTLASFASGIKPIEIVSSLPTTGNTEGRLVYLTTDDKIYRYTGSAWSADVAAVNITGQLVSDQIANLSITNAKLASLAVDASKLANNAVTETKISDNSISTPKIQASAIVADLIAANAITVSKLAVADLSNLVDGSLADQAAWTSTGQGTWAFPIGVDLDGYKATIQYQHTVTGLSAYAHLGDMRSKRFSVVGGKTYAFGCKLRWTGSGKGRAQIGLFAYDQSGAEVVNSTTTAYDAPGNTTTGELSFQYTMPANATEAVLRLRVAADANGEFAPAVRYRDIYARIAANAELIVDGSITAVKVAANAINADKIASSAITTDKLAANAVTTAKIAAGAVSADQIAANAVTTVKLAANSVTSEKVVASSITAREMVLTDWTNIITNPNFSQGENGWAPKAAEASVVTAPGTNPPSAYAISLPSRNAAYTEIWWDNASVPKYAVSPGDSFYLEAWVYSSPGTDTDFSLALRYGNAVDTSLGSVRPPYQNPTNGEWVKLSGTVTVPNTVNGYPVTRAGFYLSVRNNGTAVGGWHVTNIVVRKAANSNLIVDGAVIADKISANAVTAAKIASSAVTADKLAANSVVAGKIAAGAVNATEIAAGAITVSKLAVMDTTNLVLNNWTGGYLDGWSYSLGSAWSMFLNNASNAINAGVQGYQVRVPENNGWMRSPDTTCSAGERYYLELTVYRSATSTVATRLQARWNLADGTTTYTTVATTTTQGAWVKLSGIVTAPDNVVSCNFWVRPLDSTVSDIIVYLARPIMRRAASSELIVDGSIIADKIATNAITTAKIAAGAVTATEIASNAVTAVKIAASAVTADKIAANSVTGDKIVANSITARELVLTDFSNIYPDFDFAVQDLYTQGSGSYSFFGTSVSNRGQYALRIPVGTSLQYRWSPYVPVQPSTDYYAEVSMNLDTAGTGTVDMLIYYYSVSSSGAYTQLSSATIASKTDTTSSTRVGAAITTPSGCRAIRFAFRRLAGGDSDGVFGGPMLRRRSNANLIVDGAISASKISVSNLAAINSNLGAITGGSLNINNRFIVTADGTTTIRNATTGARLVISNTLIQVYDANNVLRVRMGMW